MACDLSRRITAAITCCPMTLRHARHQSAKTIKQLIALSVVLATSPIPLLAPCDLPSHVFVLHPLGAPNGYHDYRLGRPLRIRHDHGCRQRSEFHCHDITIITITDNDCARPLIHIPTGHRPERSEYRLSCDLSPP